VAVMGRTEWRGSDGDKGLMGLVEGPYEMCRGSDGSWVRGGLVGLECGRVRREERQEG
jgi:hypothetical protein